MSLGRLPAGATSTGLVQIPPLIQQAFTERPLCARDNYVMRDPGKNRIQLKSVIPVHCQNVVSARGGTFVPWKAKATSAKQSRTALKPR